MRNSFLKNYLYACEQVTGSNNRVSLLSDMSTLNKGELIKCFDATNLKQKDGVSIPCTVIEKASIFFYELLRKPISREKHNSFACLALLLFIYERGYWIRIPQREFYDLIIWIRASNPLNHKETVRGINKVFEKYFYPVS